MNKEQRIFLEEIAEDFCLGFAGPADISKLLLLCKEYPDAQSYIDSTEKAIEALMTAHSRRPSLNSKHLIHQAISDQSKLNSAELVGEEKMLNEFIGISRHSEVEKWEELLKDVEPATEFDNIHTKPLWVSIDKELTLIWVKEMVPNEIHVEEHESFFLLQGTADCYVGEEVIPMKRGDYMNIPLHVPHKILVTSATPGKALLSRVAVY